ncbi:amylo-alpha-1,6-glucosidase [Marinitenerispora sediminis]|uniref:Amylo-alpha-1,6-glucosidase n=1 Tax=Marinitenerispora sediminis TaxID=1931232 RepID=A0A368T6X9_9ACTN|nr:glycogen debranching N-terminal domain-containing protein [Marinitenerispora sediminis]RCV52540.1 amylo-alpha-1,6-glucosidase [Marinitenerispora sediminis]RCV59499.1 amylo-alpha-1,6-glucosidase [Marinitenerispora sediminis]RCV59606.1 amylo-alpha-1,6-glucosidase [Marinitenerispora sediminis]
MADEPRVIQPYLHRLLSCVRAPSVVLAGEDGQIRPGGTQGWLRDDTRLLSLLAVDLDGVEPEPVGHALLAADHAAFTAVARLLGDTGADPTVRVERHRTVHPDGLTEAVRLANDARAAVRTRLRLRLAADLAGTSEVKHGEAGTPVPVSADGGRLTWGSGAARVEADVEPAPDRVEHGPEGVELLWDLEVPAHTDWRVVLRARAAGSPLFAGAAPESPEWPVSVASRSRDLDRVVRRGAGDLEALRLTDPEHPEDTFLAAGSPWFFTLFGRDSLWAARMLLPASTDLAGGTLRILARRQGTRHDRGTAEQPGRILHEVRGRQAVAAGHMLPPLYYGTIDATPLWVVLLRDAWRWGLPENEVRELLPALRAALDWVTGPADDDGDGFLDYIDTEGTGLANQGWKDSGDSIQWPDGRIATAPIALCEAQAYAHEAAVAGAELLTAFGEPGAAELLEWAERMRDRFRGAFWVGEGDAAFPAIALDGAKRPVATPTSNLGHLLGTGLLDERESALVAARLAGHDLDCGYGLRTMSSTAAGFNPLGYHAGSVWPHDTAIAVLGLSRTGAGPAAASLARGLVDAAAAFDHRLPELFAGTDARAGEPVLAYPASCRPQAWSAAAGVALVSAALRLSADLPAGVLRVDPDPAFADWFPMTVDGLRVGGHPLRVTVDADGAATVETSAPVRVEGAVLQRTGE